MTESRPKPPAWQRNTYFWIGALLVLLGVAALIFGAGVVRDPGQKREAGIAWFYLLAGVVMFANGWLSHRQTVRAYEEATRTEENS